MARYWDQRTNPLEFRAGVDKLATPVPSLIKSVGSADSAKIFVDLEEGIEDSSPDKIDVSRNSVGLTAEDAAFTAMLKKKSHAGVLSTLTSILLWVPLNLYAFGKFLPVFLIWGSYDLFACLVWECCGVPIKKLNKVSERFKTKWLIPTKLTHSNLWCRMNTSSLAT